MINDTDGMVLAHLHENALIEKNAALLAADRAKFLARPSIMLRVSLERDGDKWCALYGSNLMEGVCGFGDSPDEACADFDREWKKKIALAGETEE